MLFVCKMMQEILLPERSAGFASQNNDIIITPLKLALLCTFNKELVFICYCPSGFSSGGNQGMLDLHSYGVFSISLWEWQRSIHMHSCIVFQWVFIKCPIIHWEASSLYAAYGRWTFPSSSFPLVLASTSSIYVCSASLDVTMRF